MPQMIKCDKKAVIKDIKEDIKKRNFEKAFISLNRITDPEDEFVLQRKYSSLFKSIPEETLKLMRVRIAVLASSTTHHFCAILVYWLAKLGLLAEMYEAEYDTIKQSILDENSDFYKFDPDITIIFTNYRDLRLNNLQIDSNDNIKKRVNETVGEYVSLWRRIQQSSKSYIIQNNADLPAYRVLGNYEGTFLQGNINLLRNYNMKLVESVEPGVAIFDLDYISSLIGKSKWHDLRYWYHSKHAFLPDVTGLVAFEMSKLIGAVKGLSKKCVVLDLDNTLWGGIIGDDGLEGIILGTEADGEAFVEFQEYLLELKNRGIILTVCSKNDESLAKEPFLKHPDMIIKLDDIAVFKANWNNKIDNIKEIALDLNIELDSMVFIDDNPVERDMVRSFLPMVETPEMPEDPAAYIYELSRHSYFEAISFSEDDKGRSVYYQNKHEHNEFKNQFNNLSEYLQNLKMEAVTQDFDKINISRVAQLINKSNQFHLTNNRYTESEILKMELLDNKFCRCFKLKDCFGDNGLISVIILEEREDKVLFIDTWVMSCRVLSRGMEEFVCNEIISIAKKIGARTILGKYIQTKKNKLVSGLYERLLFSKVENNSMATFWELKVDENTRVYETFIKRV